MRVSTREAAERVRKHPKTIRDWAKAGRVRAYRVGPHLVEVELDDVLAVVEPRPYGTDAGPKAAA